MGLFGIPDDFGFKMLLPQISKQLKAHPEVHVETFIEGHQRLFVVAVPEDMVPPEVIKAFEKEVLNGG